MELMEGVKITDREALVSAGIEPRKVAELLNDAFAASSLSAASSTPTRIPATYWCSRDKMGRAWSSWTMASPLPWIPPSSPPSIGWSRR